jgi:hypothetical protein
MDGWAHNHVAELETFFTPWHAAFYSGYLAIVLVLIGISLHHPKGHQRLPPGYDLAVIGVLIFFFGGVGDMFWHIAFGVEKDIEALFSPTHLLLATGGVLMLGAPLLHAFRTTQRHAVATFATTLSLTYVIGSVTFMTQFHSIADLRAAGALPERAVQEWIESLTMAGYQWHTAVLMAGLFFLLRRFRPAMGTFSLYFTILIGTLAMVRQDTFVHALPIICIGYATGFATDLLLRSLALSDKTFATARIIGFAVPFFLFTLLTLYMLGKFGTWWSVHLWAGAPVIAGLVGLLVSFLAVPPRSGE